MSFLRLDIDEVTRVISTDPQDIPPKKFVYTFPRDHYRKDLDDVSPKTRLYKDMEVGIKHPNDIKRSIELGESIWYVEAFNVKDPHGWSISIPREDERVCSYQGYKTCIYPKCFLFGM